MPRTNLASRSVRWPFGRSGRVVLGLAAGATTLAAAGLATAGPVTMPDQWNDAIDVRLLGPSNMSGRITDISVYEADPNIYYATAASGGLLKTTNGGTTFEHLFSDGPVASMGDVEVFQGDPDIVWIGTGEENPRNSSSYGNGVYKSVDGGKTWEHMGLKDSFQIGSIRIHPTNPDIVYVGALGRLWGPNEERGLFRTTDGGETWEHIVKIDENTGVMDIELHPEDPDTMLVATYERRRDMFDTNDPITKFGEHAGIWMSRDGGDNFERLTDGLPTVKMGRIDVDYHQADPNIVYAIIETELIGLEPEDAAYMGIRGEAAGEFGAKLTEVTEDGPAEAAGLKAGDVILGMDDIAATSYDDFVKAIRLKRAGDTVTVKLARDGEMMEMELTFAKRPGQDGEVDRERARRSSPWGTRLGGQRGNIQDEQGADGFQRGGIFKSVNGGQSWSRINSLNPRPMYFSELEVDPSDPDHLIVAGISLHQSEDGGKTFRSNAHVGANGAAHVDHHAIWISPEDSRHVRLGNDGGIYHSNDKARTWDHHNHFAIGQFYHVTVDQEPNYRVYGGLQDNGSWGSYHMVRDAGGTRNEDWFRVGGGDGFICAVDPMDPDEVYYQSQNGGYGRINLRTGERGRVRPVAQRGVRYRFNWRAPYILSHYNSRNFYAAGNVVFKSVERGERMEPISPEITATDRGAATALAESPRDKDYLFVGTDDGALWATWDGGDSWHDLFEYEESAEGDDDGGEARRERRGRRGGEGRGTRGQRGQRAAAPVGGAGGGAGILQMLASRDANGDGKVTMDEAGDRMQRMFTRLDANEDGAIDRAEMKTLADRFGVELPAMPEAVAAADEMPAAMSSVPGEDPISGTWTGTVSGDMGEQEVSMEMTLDGTKVKGILKSEMGDMPVSGEYDVAKRTMNLDADNPDFPFSIELKIGEGGGVSGDVSAGGMVMASVNATRSAKPAAAEATEATDVIEVAEVAEASGPQRIDALVPARMLVSEIVPSRYDENRVYMTMTGHRSNVDDPYVFMSEDAGKTWVSIVGNLTAADGVSRTIAEDSQNPDVLWLGTEFGLYVSLDRGTSWARFTGDGFPTVAVHAIAQHESSGDVIIGTHGRSIWIFNGNTVRQMDEEAIAASAMLYTPADLVYWRRQASRGSTLRAFTGENPSQSATVHFSLANDARNVSLEVQTLDGRLLRTLNAPTEAGLHAVRWDGRQDPPPGANAQRRRWGGPRVEPGTYRVVLSVDGATMHRDMTVTGDPESPATILWGEHWDEQLELWEAEEAGDDEGDDTSERVQRDV